MADELWHYAQDGKECGPVSFGELLALFEKGVLGRMDMVWKPGMAEWAAAGELAVFSNLFGGRPGGVQGGVAAIASGVVMPLAYQSPIMQVQGETNAGFWMRFGAAVVDWVVTFVTMIGASFVMGFVIGFLQAAMGHHNRGQLNQAVAVFPWVWGTLVGWLYSALMESSRTQGTLGKMALGIRVTDESGRRISFGRATGRHFAKWISWVIFCIGYMMAGWTQRKQALHDMIAGTLVVRGRI